MYSGMMEGNTGWSVIEEDRWRKGPWTSDEDKLLIEYVKLHGEGRWNSVSRLAGRYIHDTTKLCTHFCILIPNMVLCTLV